VVAVVERLHDHPVGGVGDGSDLGGLLGIGGEGLLAEHVLARASAASVHRPWRPFGSGL